MAFCVFICGGDDGLGFPPMFAKFISVVASSISMAATIPPFSLLRNYAATTARAFVTLKPSYTISSTRLLLPLPSRRLQFYASATNNEEAASRAAAANADSGAPTIFDKIIAKEIPSSIVYEDEKVLAFRDINPQAPVHVLVIPKFRDGLTELGKAEARHGEILGQLLYAAKIVAEKEGILDGFRVVINNGADACQSVYHLHLHVLGGRQLKWPPG
ncbi:adenylylsulfatase hint1 [Fagus crenata]